MRQKLLGKIAHYEQLADDMDAIGDKHAATSYRIMAQSYRDELGDLD
jgi:hypothetical protein